LIPFNKQPLSTLNNIPRFIELGSDYTANFGFQWNKYSQTQIDVNESENAYEVSKKRLFNETNWSTKDVEGKNILEAGSGAGRFTQVLLAHTKAQIHSFDYSSAVEANKATNEKLANNNFTLFQASIYEIPFAPQQFDKVLCLGVLQHTPSFKNSIAALCQQVKPGGELVVDFYPIKGLHTKLCAKYIFRPFVKKLSPEKLNALIEKNVDWMISLSFFLQKIKLGVLRRFIPIVDIFGTLPYTQLTKVQLREYCILDTLDMFGPEYDNPQRISTVQKWTEEAGLKVTFAGFINTGISDAAVVRAIRK
jgi:2-polyprenyl-3-methyl-5-hydroxy-6-metoxy-1,4-benzoquinol methylase